MPRTDQTPEEVVYSSPEVEAYYRLSQEGFDMQKYSSERKLLHALLDEAVDTLHKHALLTNSDLLRWARMRERMEQQQRQTHVETVRDRALAKLDAEERAALGLK